MADIHDLMTATLRAAPELQQAPWLAVPVAKLPKQTVGDIKTHAQAAGHAANMTAHHKATKEDPEKAGAAENALSWMATGMNAQQYRDAQHAYYVNAYHQRRVEEHDYAKTLGISVEQLRKQGRIYDIKPFDPRNEQIAGLAGGDLGQPLREAQHQYRALRDVYERKGIVAGLTETALVAGGATAGSLLAGTQGGVLGGETAAGISLRTLHKDSWDRTADGDAYRDGLGHKVSIGRDVAGLVGLDQGTLPYNAVSGVGDALFDLTADPLANAAGVAHGFNATIEPAGGLLGKLRGDTVLRSADDIDRLLDQRPIATHRLFDALAGKQAAEVARDFPQFGPIARDLGAASSVDDVAQVFRDALQGPELLGHALPTNLHPPAPATEQLTSALDDTPIGRLHAFARRATTKIPLAVDPDTLEFTAAHIDPARNDNFGAVRAALKFGRLPDRVIDGVMNDYINAVDTGQRRLIFRNALVRSLLSTGIGDDSQIVQRARQEVADAMGGISGAEGAHYGFDISGRDLSHLPTDNGGMTTASIYQGQRGDLRLPEFKAWTRAVREAQGAKALFGRLDDWAFRRIIVPFKALNLLTGGFALRVSTAELIPSVLRNGVGETIRASAAARAARMETTLADEEAGHIAAAAAKMLRGPTGFLARDEDIDLATELIARHDGHIVAPAVRAGDFVHNDAIGKLEAERANIYNLIQDTPTYRETDQFRGFGQGERDQPLYWQRAIREAASDEGAQLHARAYRAAYEQALQTGKQNAEAVKAATRAAIRVDEEYLRNVMDPQELSDFTRSIRAADPNADPILEFARTRVEATKGLTHAPVRNGAGQVVGQPHFELLDHIGRGETPELPTLEAIALPDRPLAVKGRVRVPDTGGNLIEKIANLGFHKVLDPIINTVGREHQYLISVKKFVKIYEPMIESGQITRDEALMFAETKAIGDVARFIHNPSERTQFSVLARNVAPFWFAQEQSYRRMGRLLATNPAAFRRYQIMISAFTDFTHEQHDAQGFAHHVIPGLGYLDETAVGAMQRLGLPVAGVVPTQVLGNVDSLSTVFPFAEGVRPSWSVFVTLPAHVVESVFPEARDSVTTLIGPAANSGSTWDVLIPSTPLRNLVKATSNSTTVASGMTSIFQSLAYQQNVAMSKWVAKGHSPDDPGAPHIIPTGDPLSNPVDWKNFTERVRNQARVNQIFRAILSAVSPVAPTVDVGDYGIKQEVQTYIDKYGYIEGTNKYLADHPDATPYTITRSKAPNDQPGIAPIAKAQAFVDAHLDLFHKYPAIAGYFVPQQANGKYDSAAYQEQLALRLRERKGFGDFVNEFFINEGFAQYEQDKAVHDQAVADMGTDDEGIKAENESWSDYLRNGLAKTNPVWWNYFTSDDRAHRRAREIDQLRVALADPKTPKTKQIRGIQGLIGDLDVHLAAMENGRIDAWDKDERQAELDSWQQYLDATAKAHPELALIISRLFSHAQDLG